MNTIFCINGDGGPHRHSKKELETKDYILYHNSGSTPVLYLLYFFYHSGTLIVTTSTRGNNINQFNIVPSCSNGAGSQRRHWTRLSALTEIHKRKLNRQSQRRDWPRLPTELFDKSETFEIKEEHVACSYDTGDIRQEDLGNLCLDDEMFDVKELLEMIDSTPLYASAPSQDVGSVPPKQEQYAYDPSYQF
ncbi:hypothetical protein KY284_020425 [Solanum tuberosum]|nr:hypothetical protein KY284_020425 [Solanum tuberosum]